jgi:hemoglobin/transferrin/lactoferrin receptor protein
VSGGRRRAASLRLPSIRVHPGSFDSVSPSRFHVPRTSAVLSLLVVATGLASAQEGGAGDTAIIDLDAITVTATKSGERVYDALSGSSVVGRDQVETQVQPSGTADVLRLIPGVAT